MQYNSLSNQADINCSTCSYKDQVYYEVNKNLLTLMLWNFYIPYVDTNGKGNPTSQKHGYRTLFQKNETWQKILGYEQFHKTVNLRTERNSSFKKF